MRRATLFILSLSLALSCTQRPEKGGSKGTDTSAADTAAKAGKEARGTILFFGNSLTAGYGLEESSLAFPGLIQKRIDSLGLPYTVVNAGVSGETTASGRGRIGWVLRQPVSVFVLELGANDGLRGIPLQETRSNLQAIIDTVRASNPDVRILLAGMESPPNMGKTFTDGFRKIFPEVAKRNGVALIPFLLEGVAGEPSLNQSDGIHPTAEGHRILMENTWAVLKDLL
jgi:acyl-CoA thioesterase-1